MSAFPLEEMELTHILADGDIRRVTAFYRDVLGAAPPTRRSAPEAPYS